MSVLTFLLFKWNTLQKKLVKVWVSLSHGVMTMVCVEFTTRLLHHDNDVEEVVSSQLSIMWYKSANQKIVIPTEYESWIIIPIIIHSKYFPVSDWLKTTRIIHHNQLLFIKFGQNLRHIESMTSKVQPDENYWTDDVKMTSKVQPTADYWTVDRENLGTRLRTLYLVSEKTKSVMAKLL